MSYVINLAVSVILGLSLGWLLAETLHIMITKIRKGETKNMEAKEGSRKEEKIEVSYNKKFCYFCGKEDTRSYYIVNTTIAHVCSDCVREIVQEELERQIQLNELDQSTDLVVVNEIKNN